MNSLADAHAFPSSNQLINLLNRNFLATLKCIGCLMNSYAVKPIIEVLPEAFPIAKQTTKFTWRVRRLADVNAGA